jgi:hypothetical protein
LPPILRMPRIGSLINTKNILKSKSDNLNYN